MRIMEPCSIVCPPEDGIRGALHHVALPDEELPAILLEVHHSVGI